jgi:uncharacterized protein DUF6496
MPDRETIQRARRDKRQGKSASTQAGEFVRREIEHIREGKHGARSAKQAIAIGLSEARRAGVDLPPRKGSSSAKSGRKSRGSSARGSHETSRKRSRATLRALKREGHQAASHAALSRQARATASARTAAQRSASAKKAARTRRAAAA